MSVRCRAAILREIGASAPYADSMPLSVEEVRLSPPESTEVVVKVLGAGLCHSDLSVIDGSRGRSVPMAMGHEGAGEIVEVGSAVKDIKAGDHVAFQFSVSCGRCANCQGGRPQICEIAPIARAKGELIGGGTRIHDLDGNPIRHQAGVSCFAEYSVVDRGSIVKIDGDLSLAKAAVFGCAIMTGVGAVVNTAKVAPGDRVALYGLGGVGLSGVMGAKAAGAEVIIAIDIDDKKFDKARKLGATHCFNARDPDLKEKVLDITAGGVDYALDYAGAIPALESAYSITRRGGTVVTAGLCPSGASFSIEQGDLVSNEKSILGSYMGSCVPVRDIPRFARLYKSGALPVDEIIDGYIGFDDINKGFDRLAAGTVIRQILLPHAEA
jgi:alcohol dehydrogenase